MTKGYAASTNGNTIIVKITIEGKVVRVKKFNNEQDAREFVESEGLIWN